MTSEYGRAILKNARQPAAAHIRVGFPRQIGRRAGDNLVGQADVAGRLK